MEIIDIKEFFYKYIRERIARIDKFREISKIEEFIRSMTGSSFPRPCLQLIIPIDHYPCIEFKGLLFHHSSGISVFSLSSWKFFFKNIENIFISYFIQIYISISYHYISLIVLESIEFVKEFDGLSSILFLFGLGSGVIVFSGGGVFKSFSHGKASTIIFSIFSSDLSSRAISSVLDCPICGLI